MSTYKLITIRILVIIAAVCLVAVGSAAAYVQLSKPRDNNTSIQTDVKTKDITIKSEKDILSASDELDSLQINDDDSKALDDLSNGF